MKKPRNFCLLITLFLVFFLSFNPLFGQDDLQINGAGASYPFPIYAQWAYHYERLTGVHINYQSIGSARGIAQLKAGLIDFSGTDAPLSKQELEANRLIQFPLIMGGVVIILNIPHIRSNEMRLTPKLLSSIFSGKITNWNDPGIQQINPELDLPNLPITIVYRADGSGTTWIFTKYLERVSETWRSNIGSGLNVRWPRGVGTRGNEGVSVTVQRVHGTIGYVEYAYALQNNLTTPLLKNEAGNYISPSYQTFAESANRIQWDKRSGYFKTLDFNAGDTTWPIFGVSFILMNYQVDNLAKTTALLQFFNWCYRHGQSMARQLHYIPVPDDIVDYVIQLWRQRIRYKDSPVWD